MRREQHGLYGVISCQKMQELECVAVPKNGQSVTLVFLKAALNAHQDRTTELIHLITNDTRKDQLGPTLLS